MTLAVVGIELLASHNFHLPFAIRTDEKLLLSEMLVISHHWLLWFFEVHLFCFFEKNYNSMNQQLRVADSSECRFKDLQPLSLVKVNFIH